MPGADACHSIFKEQVTIDKLVSKPVQFYSDFVLNVCMPYLDDIQNDLKPSFCTFIGVYVLKYLEQVK